MRDAPGFRLQKHPEMCARKMRFCFDLDNTLVTRPRIANDYTTVDPVTEMIQLVRPAGRPRACPWSASQTVRACPRPPCRG